MKGRNIAIIVGALVVAVASKFLFPVGQPHVEVKAEELFCIVQGSSGCAVPFTNSLLVTVIVDVLLIVLALAATSNMQLIPRGLQNIMEFAVDALYKVFQDVNREYIARVFPVIATIFFFVFVSNLLGLIPLAGIGLCKEHHAPHQEEHMEGEEHGTSFEMRLASMGPTGPLMAENSLRASEGEVMPGCSKPGEVFVPLLRSPSADLNFTFALALLSFVYIEYWGFQAFGIGYLGKFFNVKEGIIGFLVGLLELISEFARILAFAFRLFGNIFAGEVVLVVLAFLIPLALPLPFYFFEVFVAFIQAFVFAILTMAFIAVAVTPHGHDDEHH